MFFNGAYALPAGFTQLAYIESTGTQYIDTGIVPQGNEVFNLGIKYITKPSSGYMQFFGTRQGAQLTATTNCWLGVNDSNYMYVRFGTVNPSQAIIMTPGSDYNITVNLPNDTIYVNNASYSFSGSTVSGITRSIYLGLMNTDSGLGTSGTAGYKKFTITRNGSVVFNGVPAKDSNGVLGMYDTVTNTFKTNIGSGTFVAGPEIGIASTSYVAGMHNAINTIKQNKLTSSGANPNVIVTGDANGIVSSFTANNGIVTVTRSAVTLPWGGETSNNRAEVWVD